MSRATSLIARLNKISSALNVTDRVVYKRKITRTGGDPLIGAPASVSYTDTKLSPQPVVDTPASDHPLILSGNIMAPLTDLLLLVSPTALLLSELQDKDIVLVFKSGTTEQEYFVHTYLPYALNGIAVAYHVLARSKKR